MNIWNLSPKVHAGFLKIGVLFFGGPYINKDSEYFGPFFWWSLY